MSLWLTCTLRFSNAGKESLLMAFISSFSVLESREINKAGGGELKRNEVWEGEQQGQNRELLAENSSWSFLETGRNRRAKRSMASSIIYVKPQAWSLGESRHTELTPWLYFLLPGVGGFIYSDLGFILQMKLPASMITSLKAKLL